MFRKTSIALVALALCGAFAPAARADVFGLSFGKSSKHGSFSFNYSTSPFHGPGRRYQPSPRTWVPGHYESRVERTWVPGCVERVWIQPVFECRYDSCGRAFQCCVAGGHYAMVQRPGHFREREFSVWVDGRWQDVCY